VIIPLDFGNPAILLFLISEDPLAFRPPITRSLALSAYQLQFSIYGKANGMPGKKSFWHPVPLLNHLVPFLYNFSKK